MGDVTQFPTDAVAVQGCLDIAKGVAEEYEARKVIVLLVHGDNDIHAVCSHDFTHHDWFGHLGVAAQGATIDCVMQMFVGDDDED